MEAPAFVADNLQISNGFSNDLSLKSQDSETTTVIGDKTYVISTTDESIGVKIYDKYTGNWVIPTVRGTEPKPCKGHSAVLLNEDRILVITKGSSLNDCLWFLEMDTPYVREQIKMVGAEVVAWSKVAIGNVEKPVVISGPSGVGKGTLISMLTKEFPSMFGFSVSHTTRLPRAMEKDGEHYHFTERSVMEKEIEDGKFLEFASVHGNLYGTSIEAVEAVADDGKRCILDIDVQGARSVRAGPLDAIFIFICPPSMEKLEERLRARGTETEEQILKRLRNAKEEIEQGKSSGIFDHILYNDNLEQCYDNLKKLLGLDGSIAANHQTGSKMFSDGFMNQCSNKNQQRKVSKLQHFSMTWLRKLVAFLIAFPVSYILRLICRDKVFNPAIGAAPEGIDFPADHSVSKVENKIIINCGIAEGKASKNLIVLDVSSLKGGAPGRTRGLQVYTVDSFSNGLNGVNDTSS